MSTTLNMLALNVPLSQWRKFEAEGINVFIRSLVTGRVGEL